jgi:hypothetical protein
MTAQQLAALLAAANAERAESGLPPLTAEVWAPLTGTDPEPTPDQTFAALAEAVTHLREAEQEFSAAVVRARTLDDLAKATAAIYAARDLFAAAHGADIDAARRALAEAEADREAEREHLAGQAARTAAATGEWVPEPEPTPPASSVPHLQYRDSRREAVARAKYDAIKQAIAHILNRPELATSMVSQELSAAAIEAGLSAPFEQARTAWWDAQVLADQPDPALLDPVPHVFQLTAANEDSSAYDRNDIHFIAITANAVYGTLARAQAAAQAQAQADWADLEGEARDPEQLPPLEWLVVNDDEGPDAWTAACEEIGVMYAITRCPVL